MPKTKTTNVVNLYVEIHEDDTWYAHQNSLVHFPPDEKEGNLKCEVFTIDPSRYLHDVPESILREFIKLVFKMDDAVDITFRKYCQNFFKNTQRISRVE